MFEARILQGSILKKVLESIKDLVTDANFECTANGFALQAMDSSHVSLVALMLRSTGFDHYRCDRDVTMGMNLLNMSKMLKCADNDDTITMKADDAGDVVTFMFENPKADKISDFQMKLMDIDTEHLGIPDTEYEATVKMSSNEFQRICRDLSSIGDTVTIAVTKDSVKFTTSGDIGEANITCRRTSDGDMKEEKVKTEEDGEKVHNTKSSEGQNVDIDLQEPVTLPRCHMMTGGELKIDKLAEVAERFNGMERGMEVNRKQRQDKEEDEIHALRINITRLENTLNQEVKRRTETNKSIQGAFEAHMATVQDRLEAGLVHRLDTLVSSVDSLNNRIGVVADEFSTARESYIRDMEDKSTLVAGDIVALKATFTAERNERKERETLIVAKLIDLDERTKEQLVKDRSAIDVHVAELQEELGVVGHEEDRRFHEFVFTELAALKTGLVQEAQTREEADDEIVNALNHYTQSVQEAMRVVNQASH